MEEKIEYFLLQIADPGMIWAGRVYQLLTSRASI
jgi:hypothetical protein